MTRGTGIMLALSVGMLAWLLMDQQRQIDRLEDELNGLVASTMKVLDLDIERRKRLEGTGDD